MRYSPCEHNLSSEGPTGRGRRRESKEALSNLQEVNPVPGVCLGRKLFLLASESLKCSGEILGEKLERKKGIKEN